MVLVALLVRYGSAIRRRLETTLHKSTFFGKPQDPFRMIRCKQQANTTAISRKLQLLELNPDFCRRFKADWKMTSSGSYLSSLRPCVIAQDKEIPEWIENEIQASLVAALLHGLGPQFGATILPGLGFVQNAVQNVVGILAQNIGSMLG
jgi:hypothetical protein